MLRRSHKKTRKGSKCDECRRRHIRCDQQHPSCINCQNSERICTYRSVDRPRATSTSSSNHAPSHSGEEASREPLSFSRPSARTANDPLVNIAHLELFHHFTQSTFLFIDKDTAFTDQLKKTALSSAFSSPYLMHGILAFAARHLSTQVVAERSRHYLDQSTRLQTWAVANFNPAPREPDRDTCVALFLFSSLICIHGLADTALLDRLNPDPFFIRFGQYFGLQRGVRTIIVDHWPQLRESEIHTLFQWCELLALRKGQGSQCDALRQLVTQSTDLSPAAAEACRLAIELLQCILDEHVPGHPVPARQVYSTLAWPLLISEKVIDLLVLRRPVALIILAYYGVTLEFCHVWMVGQVGKHVVHAVNRHLGSSWDSWLRWPCEAIGIELL
ncbi:hypothetical protein F4803DRAFT_263482 [Xylaria telfairii]|nr:hypothetical protein F4803DRAFT_263482 [Xylaria telfairii]